MQDVCTEISNKITLGSASSHKLASIGTAPSWLREISRYPYGEDRGMCGRRSKGRAGFSGRQFLRNPFFQFQGRSSSSLLSRMIGDAGEHVGEPGLRIDVVEPCGLDQGVHDGGTLAAAIGAGEQPRLAAERNLAVILPISGRMLWSNIAGIRCTDRGCVVFRASGAHRVSWCTWN